MNASVIVTLDVEPPRGEGYDEVICVNCAQEIEPEHEVAYEPSVFNAMPTPRTAVEPVHTWCAVQDGYRLRWRGSVPLPEDTSEVKQAEK